LRRSTLENREFGEDVSPWTLVKQGEINISTMFEGYKHNLQVVLQYAKKLVSKLGGKTVITSDHGELFGERPHRFLYPFKTYEHPTLFHYVKPLVKVPWLVVDREPRKKVSEGKAITREPRQTNYKEITSKLKALGYL
jgi:hypothetical protein